MYSKVATNKINRIQKENTEWGLLSRFLALQFSGTDTFRLFDFDDNVKCFNFNLKQDILIFSRSVWWWGSIDDAEMARGVNWRRRGDSIDDVFHERLLNEAFWS